MKKRISDIFALAIKTAVDAGELPEDILYKEMPQVLNSKHADYSICLIGLK